LEKDGRFTVLHSLDQRLDCWPENWETSKILLAEKGFTPYENVRYSGHSLGAQIGVFLSMQFGGTKLLELQVLYSSKIFNHQNIILQLDRAGPQLHISGTIIFTSIGMMSLTLPLLIQLILLNAWTHDANNGRMGSMVISGTTYMKSLDFSPPNSFPSNQMAIAARQKFDGVGSAQE